MTQPTMQRMMTRYQKVWCATQIFMAAMLFITMTFGVTGTVTTASGFAVAVMYLLFAFHDIYVHQQIARRIRDGHCVTCGYDLRESTDICPECGEVISANGKQAKPTNLTDKG